MSGNYGISFAGRSYFEHQSYKNEINVMCATIFEIFRSSCSQVAMTTSCDLASRDALPGARVYAVTRVCGPVEMAELHVIGQIVEATNFEDRCLFAKWSLHCGSNWTSIEGHTSGQTQLSFRTTQRTRVTQDWNNFKPDDVIETPCHKWNHPLDVHYASNSLQGWPRLEVQIWGVDWMHKCNISAYGYMNIPTSAGQHELTCSTWRPVGDFRRRIIDYVTGYRMHLVDPSDVVSNGLNRHVIRTKSMGSVKVDIAVVLRDFDKYGIET